MCHFGRFSKTELILFIQTTDASIKLYKYRGLSGFQKIHTIKVNHHNEQNTLKTNLMQTKFSLVENQLNFVYLIILDTGLEIGIIECVFN